MNWNKIDMVAARIIGVRRNWVKWTSPDIDVELMRTVDARSAEDQKSFKEDADDLVARGGVGVHLTEQQTQIVERMSSVEKERELAEKRVEAAQKKAEKQVEKSILGVKGFSALLGGLLGLLAIFGISSFADIQSGAKELDSIRKDYRTEVEAVKVSKLFLTQELARVRQRSNRLLEVMQRIKNDEFQRSFQDLYAVLPYQPGAYVTLEDWLAAREPNIVQIEQFLELEKVSRRIEEDVLKRDEKERAKAGNYTPLDKEAREDLLNNAVDLDSYRSLINFRSLRLQYQLFEMLSKWAAAERKIALERDQKKRAATIQKEVSKIEVEWNAFAPRTYFGTQIGAEWEKTTKGEPFESPGGQAESGISIGQDREMWDLVTQVAVLRGIVLCNLRVKAFDVMEDSETKERDDLQRKIDETAKTTKRVIELGYAHHYSSIGPVGARADEEAKWTQRKQTGQQRRASERYFVEFFQHVTKATLARKKKEDTAIFEGAVTAMETAGKELAEANVPELEAYHQNVIANYRLWQSIRYGEVGETAKAKASLELAAVASRRGLSLSPSRDAATRGSRNTLLRLTNAEVKISEFYEQMKGIPLTLVSIKAKMAEYKNLKRTYDEIMNTIRSLAGTEVGDQFLKGKSVKENLISRFPWFYSVASLLEEGKPFPEFEMVE